MRPRKGISLIEVLMAIFVMALGLMALLTLFPLGAVSMAQAIQDDRTAHAAANATALAHANNLRTTATNSGAFTSSLDGGTSLPTTYDGPSYPVFLDPFFSTPTVLSGSQRLASSPRIRRYGIGGGRSLYALGDDIQFNLDGVPDNSVSVSPPQFRREYRYSWAYLMQRPDASDAAVVNMWVIVYSGRSLQIAIGEDPYLTVSDSGSNGVGQSFVTLTWDPSSGQEKPPIRKGGWILDATYESNDAQRKLYGPIHGTFYRVVAVTERPNNTLLLELQTPLKAPARLVLVMENVVEVFERGAGWKSN